MYKVYCDDYLLYDGRVDELKIFAPKVNSVLNSVGSFTFTIYPEHPYFDVMQKLKSIITVKENDKIIFRGRILNDKNGLNNEKKVTCESDLSYLLDSVQRPYEFQGTPADLFRQFITNHNSEVEAGRRFKIGNITVTDPNDYIARSDTQYLNTWQSIQNKLIKGLGGYLWVRYEEDGTYIDYLEDFNLLAPQKIEFGVNLLSYQRNSVANDIFTVIVPVGASDDEGNKLTIKDVNDGKDYLENTEAIQKYGRIVKMVEWDDVTIPYNLKTKGQKYLDESVLLLNRIELTAADLSAVDSDILAFHLGTKVHVISKQNNVDDYFLVKKLSIDLLNSANNKLALDSKSMTLTERNHTDIQNFHSEIITRTDDSKINAITETVRQLQSDFEATSEGIMTNVSENYYLKEDTDKLIESAMTTFEQTKDSFDFRFDKFETDVTAAQNNTDAQFLKISKYIRFENGKILLGETGNQLELQISNDRISFVQNNSEVAYFSNDKLFVTDGEYVNSLQLGKFAFLPRASGNLSFKKVRD